jgi:large subunit ribosomal protein L5
MQIFEYYYTNIIRYDLINKFYYNNHKQIPKVIKIVLNFNCNSVNIKRLISSMVALELITNQKSVILTSKKANISLKLRKGNPIGCKVTLKKKNMNIFFFRLISEIFPNIKLFEGFINKKSKNKSNSFSFKIVKLYLLQNWKNIINFLKIYLIYK